MGTKENLIKFMRLGLLGIVPLSGPIANASELAIQTSEIGATVSVIDHRDDKRTELGITPLSVAHYEEKLGGNTLVVEKPGFAPVYLPISEKLDRDVKIKIELKRLDAWDPVAVDFNQKVADSAENLVDQIVAVQGLLDERKVKEGLSRSEELRASYPRSVSAKVLYANALLLSGQTDKASSLYTELLADIPESRKVLRQSIESLKNRISKIGSGRIPARAPLDILQGGR
jgi:hypothetical protein